MTNFEFYTQNPQELEFLIDLVVADALDAEGCSMRLQMPALEAEPGSKSSMTNQWSDWFQEEYSGRWK